MSAASALNLNILVIGATGQQGGAVIDALISVSTRDQRALNVFALTRDTTSPAATSLAQRGVTLVLGSLSSKAALSKSFSSIPVIDAAFIALANKGAPGAEATMGYNAVEALKEKGIGQIVYTSVDGVDRDTSGTWASKRELEEFIAGSGLRYTILRPTGFYQNWGSSASWKSWIMMGFFKYACGEKKVPMISLEDIGSIAAQSLLNVTSKSTCSSIAGDLMSMDELAVTFSRLSGGKSSRVAPRWLVGLIIKISPAYIVDMLKFFEEDIGPSSEIVQNTRALYPGVKTFADWVADQ